MSNGERKKEDFVKIVEVAPRDGLQNEKWIVPTKVKIDLINKLTDCGLSVIETTSFINPKWVPQMGDNKDVFAGITRKEGVSYPVLVPNMRGFHGAHKAGVEEIAVFVGASESFSRKNTNCSISEGLTRAENIASAAKQANIRVRGYVSCVLGCPYEGYICPKVVSRVVQKLYDIGCYEISLGDTIGVGTPGSTLKLLKTITSHTSVPKSMLAVHFHDTYSQALPNIVVALQEGIRVIDSSVAGLGGCPYADGATGNVSSEDVIYMIHGMGYHTNVDLAKLINVGAYISNILHRRNKSSVGVALLAKNKFKPLFCLPTPTEYTMHSSSPLSHCATESPALPSMSGAPSSNFHSPMSKL